MAEDKVKTLEFIEDYRKYQVLWNPKHKDYTNKTKRNDALISLSKKYNYGVNNVKNKVKSLRSYFSKEHRKVMLKKSESEAEDTYESSWFAYNSLLFILNSITPRETLHTVERASENQSTATTQVKSNKSQVSFSESTEHEFISPLRKKRNVCKVRVDERDEAACNILDSASEKMNKKDECDAFGQLIACKLRMLNPRTRLLAEHRINDILYNLELEEMDSKQQTCFVAPPATLSADLDKNSLPYSDNMPSTSQNTDS